MKLWICGFISFLVAFSSMAQQEEFVKAFSENTTALSLNEGGLSDEGAVLLAEAVAQSQFILIGEAHGLKEIQEFSAALFDIAYANNFKALVVETDPFAADALELLATMDDETIADFHRKFPMAIPFFHSVEGMNLAKHVYETSNGSARLWGVDQVFVVGPRLIFSKLGERADTEAGMQLAKEYQERATVAFEQAMQANNPGAVLMTSLTEEDFDKMRSAFANDETSLKMVEQLRLSQEIYQYWYAGEYYLNNSVRSQLMKRLFNEYYHEVEIWSDSPPKVMVKLGANHCVRGLTPTRIYDLGNMLSEMADIQGNQSLHIKLTGAKGQSFNMLGGVQDFDSTEDWHEWINEALADHLANSSSNMLLIDMRPLRNLRLKEADQEIKDLVFGFDMWAIILDAHPVTPIE